MNDENLYIIPDPPKVIPEPEIPANEAWNNMAAMLDVEMPVSPPDSVPSQKPPSSGGGGIIGGGIQFLSLGLIVLGVAGLVLWGILRHVNKPETSVINKDTINVIQPNKVIDSVTTSHQNKISFTGNTKSQATNGNRDTKIDLGQKPANRNITVQPKVAPQATSIAKNEQHPTLTFSSVSKPSKPKTKEIVSAQTGIYHSTTSVTNNSTKQYVIEEKLNDTVKPFEIQSNPTSPKAVTVKSSDNIVPALNPIVNPVPVVKADNTLNNAGYEESKNSLTMSNNLSWQLGVSGNIGEVVQKGRNPNLNYGGMVTGGLWHKKLKAGIETGIGLTVYNDYGSVLKNVRITDSISGDTVNPVTHIDTTRIDAYKYRYQYIQVPLFISKQVMSKGKFALDIKTGPVIGFLISQRQINDYTSGPENGEILGTADNDYTRLKISWQWDVMVQLRWNFNDKLSSTLNPSGILYLNNLYENNNRPASMPFGIGVSAGLIYKFK